MRIANCFSGGVFLALAFGHLLPHAIGHFSEVMANKEHAPTLASVICAAGYLLVCYCEILKRIETNPLISKFYPLRSTHIFTFLSSFFSFSNF